MYEERDLGGLPVATLDGETVIYFSFVRIDFPSPTGTKRYTNFPGGYIGDLGDGGGIQSWEFAHGLRVQGISTGQDILDVSSIEFANLDNVWSNYVLNVGIEERPVQVIEGWFEFSEIDHPMFAGSGDYRIRGVPGVLRKAINILLTAAPGSFLRGDPGGTVLRRPARILHAAYTGGCYEVQGYPAQLTQPEPPLVAGTGAFIVTGTAITLTPGYLLTEDGDRIVSESVAILKLEFGRGDLSFDVEHGAFAWTGIAAGLTTSQHPEILLENGNKLTTESGVLLRIEP